MKKLITLAAGLALMAGASTAAQAQTCNTAGCSVTHTLTATANTVLKLTETSNSSAFGAIDETMFDNATGATVAGPTVSLLSNVNAHVEVSAGALTGTGNTSKSAGDFSWSSDAGSTYHAINSGDDMIAVAKGNRNVTIQWKSIWNSATDGPGTYNQVVNLTLTVP